MEDKLENMGTVLKGMLKALKSLGDASEKGTKAAESLGAILELDEETFEDE